MARALPYLGGARALLVLCLATIGGLRADAQATCPRRSDSAGGCGVVLTLCARCQWEIEAPAPCTVGALREWPTMALGVPFPTSPLRHIRQRTALQSATNTYLMYA